MTTVYDRFPTHDLAPGMLDAPAFHRNIDAIMGVLKQELNGTTRHITEIGSGTGQHAIAIASEFETTTYQPSDINPDYRQSTKLWTNHSALSNILEPIEIDLLATRESEATQIATTSAVLCFNVIHIAPVEVISGLGQVAGKALEIDGKLSLYGPYRIDGKHTSQSNQQFDQSLKLKNPDWGVRDLEAVDEIMTKNGLNRTALHAMPANNFMPVYQKPR